MDQDQFKKESHLRTKLDEYHVDIPDFPMKAKGWDRFIHILASPTKDPLDPLVSTPSGVMTLKIAPAVGIAGLVIVQALFFF
jgi:hypothetical protein